MFYLDLFRACEHYQVRYALVGGLAMNLHGVPRTTMDIDLVLALDESNLKAFLQVAEALKLKPVAPVEINELLDSVKRQQWIKDKGMVAFALRSDQQDRPTVDVLIDPPIDIEQMLRHAITQKINDTVVMVAAVEDLIELKRVTGREQDLSDIEQLQRLQRM